MRNGYTFKLILEIVPVLLIPYLAIILSVLSYFLYKKYQVRIQIKNVPYSTIFDLDLDKVKKNLKIESMVYNFVIALTMLEILTNVLGGIGQFLSDDINVPIQYSVKEGTRNETKTDKIMLIVIFSREIPMSLVIPVGCLLLIVLRRAFINLPYRIWVGRYIMYILFRLVMMLVMSWFKETAKVLPVILLLIVLFDICVYISSSRAFYVLLKGRRDEALYHSTRRDYLEKNRVANRFFYAQIFSYCGIFLLILHYASDFSLSAMDFLASSYFGAISFGLSRKFILLCPKCWNITKFICNNTYGGSIFVLDICLFFSYLFIFVNIAAKLFIRRRNLSRVNDWLTRPLMESYRASLEERTQQRRPFIQAIRSHLVY